MEKAEFVLSVVRDLVVSCNRDSKSIASMNVIDFKSYLERFTSLVEQVSKSYDSVK
ncbi:MAG: hypothetical protein HQK96_06135 [Nitrospirae bacterium]|nr:hypothetical protein [Nitrospirota bacterium]